MNCVSGRRRKYGRRSFFGKIGLNVLRQRAGRLEEPGDSARLQQSDGVPDEEVWFKTRSLANGRSTRKHPRVGAPGVAVLQRKVAGLT